MTIAPIIPISRPQPFDDPAYLYELKYAESNADDPHYEVS